MSEFSVGDVVWLKSGPPAMCVEKINPDGSVCVLWAPADGGAHLRDRISPELLTEQRINRVAPFKDTLRY